MKILLFFFILLPGIGLSQITGKVTYVSDGDTFHLITSEGNKIKVRVADIDCPERSQDYGLEAKEFVVREIKDKTVSLQIKETDRYRRKVAFVTYSGKDLSEELLKNGLAWHYKRYSNKEYLGNLEMIAKESGKGLWSVANPIAPWEWRKQKK